jgi:hypothetical protein
VGAQKERQRARAYIRLLCTHTRAFIGARVDDVVVVVAVVAVATVVAVAVGVDVVVVVVVAVVVLRTFVYIFVRLNRLLLVEKRLKFLIPRQIHNWSVRAPLITTKSVESVSGSDEASKLTPVSFWAAMQRYNCIKNFLSLFQLKKKFEYVTTSQDCTPCPC